MSGLPDLSKLAQLAPRPDDIAAVRDFLRDVTPHLSGDKAAERTEHFGRFCAWADSLLELVGSATAEDVPPARLTCPECGQEFMLEGSAYQQHLGMGRTFACGAGHDPVRLVVAEDHPLRALERTAQIAGADVKVLGVGRGDVG